jgi:DNA (cytosine-5)-methyltransferase 1
MTSKDQLTMIDLFAGSGGLGLGLEMAGFTPVYVNELNKHARETYLINREHQHPLLRQKYNSEDIGDAVKTPSYVTDLLEGFRRDYGLRRKDVVDLVVGGPPCQGYSSVGLRRSYSVDRSSVPANHLYGAMVKFIKRVRPRAFLFENVAGLLQARWTKSGSKGEIFEDVLRTFKSIPDYSVKHKFIQRIMGFPRTGLAYLSLVSEPTSSRVPLPATTQSKVASCP